MKPDIHPAYHEITVVRPNGEKFTTRSTYGQAGASIQLDVDPSTHPAWNKGEQRLDTDGRATKFANRFALGSAIKAASVVSDAAKAAPINKASTMKEPAKKKK